MVFIVFIDEISSGTVFEWGYSQVTGLLLCLQSGLQWLGLLLGALVECGSWWVPGQTEPCQDLGQADWSCMKKASGFRARSMAVGLLPGLGPAFSKWLSLILSSTGVSLFPTCLLKLTYTKALLSVGGCQFIVSVGEWGLGTSYSAILLAPKLCISEILSHSTVSYFWGEFSSFDILLFKLALQWR